MNWRPFVFLLAMMTFTGGALAQLVPSTSHGAYSSATVGMTSAQVLEAGGANRVFLELTNPNVGPNAATIWCLVGPGTAVANAAGTIPLLPGASKWWDGSFVPQDSINCIANANGAGLTIGIATAKQGSF